MTDLVPYSPDQVFALADRIAKSNLLPKAYRGNPTDAAIAMMYGAEMGLPPMTSLQRVVVVEGKPTADAQCIAALIRERGHSLIADVSSTSAKVTGKRQDTGDTMTVTWTMDDAKRANLAGKQNWRQYPADMLWARAVTQLGRRLFPDVLMAISYTPEEMESVVEQNGKRAEPVADAELVTPPKRSRVRKPPKEDIADAEIVSVEEAEQVAKAAEVADSERIKAEQPSGICPEHGEVADLEAHNRVRHRTKPDPDTGEIGGAGGED